MQRNGLARILMKEMKRFLVLFFAIGLVFAGCQAPVEKVADIEPTTIVLVRHAEKADDGTKDPSLDSLGMQRAIALKQTLADLQLTGVYSTPYKRTNETVDAIARENNLAVTEYDPGNKEFLAVEVSGHSNTVPAMVNQLIGSDQFENLEDWQYDFLYIINIGQDTTFQVLHYGAPSVRPK
jgi:2,3-bisphosphoglycerate-dependent phosphoglycerate mutase